MKEKITKAIKNPEKIKPYLRYHIGEKIERRYLNTFFADDGEFIKEVQDSVMKLPVHDSGISRKLIKNGIREPRTTKIYQRQLQKLSEEKDDIVVIDIGANIGYYALMPAAILGENTKVIAIEAHPDNTEILENNVEINDYSNINVIQKGVGKEEDQLPFKTSGKSNCHRFVTNPSKTDDCLFVDVAPLPEILEETSVGINNIDVIRMDVEGYEANIFRGMEAVFETEVMFQIEIHPEIMSRSDTMDVYNMLFERPNSSEIIAASKNSKKIKVESGRDLLEHDYLELLVRINHE